MMRAEATPWPVWLGFALSAGVSPLHFWRLSLREWRALTAPPQVAVLDRAALDALAARFPDQNT